MCGPAAFMKTKHVLGILIWLAEQDSSHKTEIYVALSHRVFAYMCIILNVDYRFFGLWTIHFHNMYEWKSFCKSRDDAQYICMYVYFEIQD
jgi:hypothetical protein